MTSISKELLKRLATSIVLLSCLGGAYLHSTTLYYAFLSALCFLIVTFELPQLFPISLHKRLLLAIFYPGFPIFCLSMLNHLFRSSNMLMPLYPFFIAWSADTGGYITGKLIGKHKMCPTISPGKTWEGFGGSILAVFTTNLFLAPALKNTQLALDGHWIKISILSAIMTVIAFLGGFMLSYFKRKQGLKDAGRVLPGHGGFLDRFDSVFFVAPAIWIVILIYQLRS